MLPWGYIPNLENGLKGFIFRMFGHPHANARIRARHVRKLIEKKKTLDIGCGEGIFYYELARRGYVMTGVDYSKEALENMKHKLTALNINPNVMHGDAQALPIESDNFEQVLCLDVIEHLKDANAAIKEMSRVLIKGGSLILSVPNELFLKKSILHLDFTDHLKAIGHEGFGFNYDELKEMLEFNGFQIVKYSYFMKYFGRFTSELVYWMIGANNIWKARKSMYNYSYKAFIVFIMTFPIVLLDELLPNKKGGCLVVKAINLKGRNE